jgi:hypothetical protein
MWKTLLLLLLLNNNGAQEYSALPNAPDPRENPAPCLDTYSCCIKNHPKNPEVCGELPRDPPPDRCKQVAVQCRAQCVGQLDRKDPFPYYRCINECLEANACPPGMY